MTAFLKGENLFMKVAKVKKVLIHKGVTELFHVNSVITSLTFINNGGLLSRETVEEYNLPQTDQPTLIKNSIYTMTYSLIRLTYMSVQRM